jgi:hypothetical protein
MSTKQVITDISNGLLLLESQQRKEFILTNDKFRLKKDVPFSPRLNDWIEDWFKKHSKVFKFVDTDDFQSNDIEGTFNKHLERYQTTGKIHIWTGSSDNTIFGKKRINWMFRAWHDYIHITLGYNYTSINESIVANIQVNQLPNEWLFEKELILCEVTGQVQYFELNNKFIDNQRYFTIDYLTDPHKALNYKNNLT